MCHCQVLCHYQFVSHYRFSIDVSIDLYLSLYLQWSEFSLYPQYPETLNYNTDHIIYRITMITAFIIAKYVSK